MTADSLARAPGALIRLGCALMGSGRGAQAHALLSRLLLARPDDPELQSAARVILSHRIPHWHKAMLLDEPRNAAFERAIERVAANRIVLDIGTGSGLLALMAARAGASKVVACEAHPALAETAREIVAQNGFADKVTVVGRRSTELDTHEDLDGGAEVIIAELFSDDLLNEGALATLHHARTRLAAPGARIIPAKASVRVALAHRDVTPNSFGDVRGFDLSRFDRHVAPEVKLHVGDKGLRLASEAADLFTFDFAGAPFAPSRREIRMIGSEGASNGIVQWIGLQLDEDTYYENRPGAGARSHWAALFHPFPKGVELAQGGSVTVRAAHDLDRLQIWFSGWDIPG
jgi:type III protein arginine methyltransferase